MSIPVWLADSTRLLRCDHCDLRLTPTNRMFLYDRRTQTPYWIRSSSGKLTGSPALPLGCLSERESNQIMRLLQTQFLFRMEHPDDEWEFKWSDE